jgi:tetraacyldisaccharide 4'-kinase
VTAWLARALRDAGRAPAVLHGGYAADEPALHAALNPDIPVVVGRDRVSSAERAIARGADVLVLDDAFQHRRIHRDVDIVLVAAESWARSRHVLPRGPWREEDTALRRASWVVVTRRAASLADARSAAADIARGLADESGTRVAIVHLAANRWSKEVGTGVSGELPGGSVFAVTAIADPDSFFANAANAGATIADRMYYPDHHDYTRDDATEIMRRAGSLPLITTAKDWVKLRALVPAENLWVLRQRVEPEDASDALMHDVLNARAR